jgi:hypothetical protein
VAVGLDLGALAGPCEPSQRVGLAASPLGLHGIIALVLLRDVGGRPPRSVEREKRRREDGYLGDPLVACVLEPQEEEGEEPQGDGDQAALLTADVEV